jgi:hypothetical protein
MPALRDKPRAIMSPEVAATEVNLRNGLSAPRLQEPRFALLCERFLQEALSRGAPRDLARYAAAQRARDLIAASSGQGQLGSGDFESYY